jgi:hypothetical protein
VPGPPWPRIAWDFSNVSPINVGKEMGMSFSPTSYGIWIYHDLPKMGDTPKLQL